MLFSNMKETEKNTNWHTGEFSWHSLGELTSQLPNSADETLLVQPRLDHRN